MSRPPLKVVPFRRHKEDQSPTEVLEQILSNEDEVLDVFVVARVRQKPEDDSKPYVIAWSEPMEFDDLIRLIKMGEIMTMQEWYPTTEDDDDATS